MSNEIKAQVLSTNASLPAYFLIHNDAGQVWQTTTHTFVTYSTPNLANYTNTMTSFGDGFFVGSFPTQITAGTYYVSAFTQIGGTPAEADTLLDGNPFDWTGSAQVQEGFFGPNTVTFVFHDVSNNPVSNVTFTVSNVASATTDNTGILAVGLPNGSYTVTAVPTSGTLFPSTNVTISGNQTVTITGTAIAVSANSASGNGNSSGLVECVVYQSTNDANGNYFQQLSNLMLDGISTNDATINHDGGKLYASFVHSGGTYSLNLYKDAAKSHLVAVATGATLAATYNFTAQNGSGLFGSVYFAQYLADDTNIQVICALSKDTDLPMGSLNGLSEYDAINGFAKYHVEAFQYLTREFVLARFKSKLFRSEWLDSRNLFGHTGGYDLSRCLNLWVLRDASAYYAFYKIAQRQILDPGGNWELRTKDAQKKYTSFLQALDLIFDTDNDRVENNSGTMSVMRFGRY